MSALCSGARNGPGRSTAWSSVVAVEADVGSSVGAPDEGATEDGPLLAPAWLDDPSPQPARTSTGTTQAATTVVRPKWRDLVLMD